ncbi:HalD/BesD family halogenase [Streptomyces monashensis]|uniref:Fe2OG dioxygenase domain-containing protein n=1 Tax=Streptomyces monashensis TaxID=1678012 RepID=A0A1S2P737_9ACTN|nr:hypothetical protein [Streptomyces monashensis]OIJ89386.1 hypothetical protein BIV23_41585 [Streptomyces monashensis]
MLFLPEYTRALSGRFSADGYLPLPGLLPPALRALRAEAARLERLAGRRDFAMECMDSSPRHMTTLGGHVIARESPLIMRLYHDSGLIRLIGRVAGMRAVPVREALERHVLNALHRDGETHGAHTDDYPLALVMFTEAPEDPADGGILEYIPRADGLCALDTPVVRRAHHRPGEGYLLRSDTTAHRVTPLRRPGVRRTVFNFAYTTSDRQQAATPGAGRLY